MKFDKALEKHIGSLGCYQILLVILACYIAIPILFTSVDSVFLLAKPKFRCAGALVPEEHGYWNTNKSTGTRNFTGTQENWDKGSCSGYFFINGTEYNNGTLLQQEGNIQKIPCKDFEYDTSIFKTTLITEWDLVCDKSFMISITKSVSMAGIMAGAGLGGFLADRFGRRPVVLVAVVVSTVCRFLMTFSPALLMYNIFNFITVSGMAVSYIVIFTLILEIVGPKWRAVVGSLMGESFALGYCILALLAYLIRDWKTLNIAIASSFIPCLALICLLPESPRWMLVKGKTEAAYDLLRKMAKRNGKVLPPGISIEYQDPTENKTKITVLFKSRKLICRYFVVFFLWFVAAFTYYGLTLNVGSLVGDIYINFTISGVLELLAYFISQFLVAGPTGRRITTSILYFLAGVSLLLTLAVPKSMGIGITILVQFGRFCVSAFYNCIYIWTGELFPTVVRNSGLSTMSCLGKIGAVLAPYAAELGRLHAAVPIVTFGCLALLGALLLLTLPETRGRPLPQTVEDILESSESSMAETYKPVQKDDRQGDVDKIPNTVC